MMELALSLRRDANGNLTSLAPPGRPEHAFFHTPVNLTSLYLPPLVADSTGNTSYLYNLDRQLVKTILSDSSSIQVVYDTAGCGCGSGSNPAKIITDRGETIFKYSKTTGQLSEIISPTLDTLRYAYDGSLPTGVTWKGLVNGFVGVTYNSVKSTSTHFLKRALLNTICFVFLLLFPHKVCFILL